MLDWTEKFARDQLTFKLMYPQISKNSSSFSIKIKTEMSVDETNFSFSSLAKPQIPKYSYLFYYEVKTDISVYETNFSFYSLTRPQISRHSYLL
jgi:hypothetical protein